MLALYRHRRRNLYLPGLAIIFEAVDRIVVEPGVGGVNAAGCFHGHGGIAAGIQLTPVYHRDPLGNFRDEPGALFIRPIGQVD